MVTKIEIANRKYYVREGHTSEQILNSLISQINNDVYQLCSAKIKNGGLNIIQPKINYQTLVLV